MSTTGERIRELRKQKKLTLDDVARYLGVGRQAVYKYEHGTVTNIPLENIDKMATLFDVTPGYLAGWADGSSDDRTIIFPDTKEFAELISAMSPEDYTVVMAAIDRTYKKIKKEKGIIK